MTQIYQHQYDNGLRLVAEPIDGAQSLALSIMLPAGVAHQPPNQLGVSPLLAEMIWRGAGDLDARAHSDALDHLGVQRGSSVESTFLRIGAAMIHTRLPDALPLLLNMATAPALDEDALEPARDLALQAIESLEDEPQQKVFIQLKKQHFPHPYDRSSLGDAAHIESITPEQIRDFWRATCLPDGTIIGVAGKFDFEQLKDLFAREIQDWQGKAVTIQPGAAPTPTYSHEEAQTTQLHIGLAYDSLPETDPMSIYQSTAAAVLSGGMSGRLFTEVREKRGLVYSVYAAYSGNKHLGAMLSYAGTTAPRAQETYDVLTHELRRISQGIEQSEFERAIIGMKSALVMQGESTRARAAAIAADQYIYGTPRTLDQRIAEISDITLEKLNRFVKEHPAGQMNVVTVGPEALTIPDADPDANADANSA